MSAVRGVAVLRARVDVDDPTMWDGMASDGARAFAWTFDGPLSVLDLSTTGLIGTLPLDQQSRVRSFVWSADRQLLATLGIDEVIRLWRANTLRAVLTISEPGTKFIALTFSEDGRALIAWDQHSERRWSVERGDSLGRPFAVGLAISSVSVSPDRSRAVLGDGKKRVQFWNLTKGSAVGGPQDVDNWSVVWSADSRTVAIRQPPKARDPDVSLWDPSTGQRRMTLPGAGSVQGFSPDGTYLLTSRDDQAGKWLDPEHGAEMRLWSVRTGEPIGAPIPNSQNFWSAVFSPDGHYLAEASGDNDVKVWKVSNGKRIATLRNGQPVTAIVWPTQETVLCQGLHGLSIWDMSRPVQGTHQLPPMAPRLVRSDSVPMAPGSLPVGSCGMRRPRARWRGCQAAFQAVVSGFQPGFPLRVQHRPQPRKRCQGDRPGIHVCARVGRREWSAGRGAAAARRAMELHQQSGV